PLSLHSFPTRRSSDLIPEIANRQSSRRGWCVDARPCRLRDVGELAIALVVKQQLWFAVSDAKLQVLYLRIDMSVHQQKVGPAIRSEEHTSELQSPDHL